MDIATEYDGKVGIYCIENIVNGKKYVGSSKNILHRLYTHRAYLRKNVHQNKKLQNSWNKHGEDNFRCYVLEFCEEAELIKREQHYIDYLGPWYNVVLEVEEQRISEESKIKMSVSRIEGFKRGTVKLYQEKQIHQYDLFGKYICSYKNIKEASRITGVTRSCINRFLKGEYRKGGNFLWSLTKEESLPAYQKANKDNSYFNKPIEVVDLENGETVVYDSITIFCQLIGKNCNCARHAMLHRYPYLKRYMIKQICRSHE